MTTTPTPPDPPRDANSGTSPRVRVLCEGTTKAGQPCRAKAHPGTNPPRCVAHTEQAEERRNADKERVIEACATYLTLTAAAEATGVGRTTIYQWMDADPAFADRLERHGREVALDRLEESLYRRATYGVDKPVYQRGEMVGTVREYDTPAGIAILKARRARLYRERASVDVTTRNTDVEGLVEDLMGDPARLAALDALLGE